MEAALQRLVRERVRNCCEYCLLPEQYSSAPFELDHIITQQHRGRTIASNLALICFSDNHYKGPNLGGNRPQDRPLKLVVQSSATEMGTALSLGWSSVGWSNRSRARDD